MHRARLFIALCSLPLLASAHDHTSACHPAPAARTLASTVWQTTAVYVGNDRSSNQLENYGGVVGLSLWNACSNRYEFFNTEDGSSYAPQGGNGDFLVTGDGRELVLMPPAGPAQRSRVETLTTSEYTYSRQVPKNLQPGQPMVTIHVVHTPYRGPLKLPAAPRPAR